MAEFCEEGSDQEAAQALLGKVDVQEDVSPPNGAGIWGAVGQQSHS